MGKPSGSIKIRETARKAGLSPSHVSSVLSGRRSPSLDVALRIARAAGITLGRLVDIIASRRPVSPDPKRP